MRAFLLGKAKSAIGALLLVISAGAISVPSRAQDTSPHALESRDLAYEVSTVRQSKSDDGMAVSVKPDGFSARNTTLFGLILNAYGLKLTNDIAGLPPWARTSEFDIDAKMDADLAVTLQKLAPRESQEARERMLRSLLADRFKLQAHFENRKRPTYSLVVSKNGPLVLPTATKDAQEGAGWGPGHIDVHSGSMKTLARCLSGVLGRFVADNTGLTGNYNLLLTWTPEEKQDQGESGPTIYTALEEQLGLKLVPSEGPVPTLIIDRAEKPSPN